VREGGREAGRQAGRQARRVGGRGDGDLGSGVLAAKREELEPLLAACKDKAAVGGLKVEDKAAVGG